jgi:hypothetical protein
MRCFFALFFFTISYIFKVDNSPLGKQISDIRRSTGHYLEIITKKLLGSVPQIIKWYLIDGLKNFLKFKLNGQLKKTGKLVRVPFMTCFSNYKPRPSVLYKIVYFLYGFEYANTTFIKLIC